MAVDEGSTITHNPQLCVYRKPNQPQTLRGEFNKSTPFNFRGSLAQHWRNEPVAICQLVNGFSNLSIPVPVLEPNISTLEA